MYFQQSEHNPPHFHAEFGGTSGEFAIKTLKMLDGNLDSKTQALVKKWARKYKKDLMEIWNTQNFKKLPPLN